MARLGGMTPPEQDDAVRVAVAEPWEDETPADLELTRARARAERAFVHAPAQVPQPS